jgi:hypothetical protein
MRVVKAADPKTWRHEIDCSGCKSTLEVEIVDLEYVKGENDGPYTGCDYCTCTCPVCKKCLTVSLELVPSELHYAIGRRR